MVKLFLIFGITLTITYCVIYKEDVKRLLSEYINWIKINHDMAAFWIVLFYLVAIPLYFPIAYANMTLGYTYAQVFESQL